MIPTKVYPDADPKTGPTLRDVADLINKGRVKNIVIMSGAGISTSCGIPDFRSPKTGLYHNLQKYKLPHPQAIFEIDYFVKKPDAFFQLAKELYPGNFTPSITHFFFVLLHKKGFLKRVFSQNIDCLDQIAGLPQEMLVEAHGSFATAKCLACQTPYSMDEIRPQILRGEVVRCSRPSCKGLKRAIVKPDIVFFGEGLPPLFFKRIKDLREADLLIVLGTSLQVQPFASLIDEVSPNCPRLLINLETVGEADDLDLSSLNSIFMRFRESGFDFSGRMCGGKQYTRDVKWIGESDKGILEFARFLGWEKELVEMRENWIKEKERKDNEVDIKPEILSSEVKTKDEDRKPSKTDDEKKLIKEEKREGEKTGEEEDKEVESLTKEVQELTVDEEGSKSEAKAT